VQDGIGGRGMLRPISHRTVFLRLAAFHKDSVKVGRGAEILIWAINFRREGHDEFDSLVIRLGLFVRQGTH
jgi:hypothetical protein